MPLDALVRDLADALRHRAEESEMVRGRIDQTDSKS